MTLRIDDNDQCIKVHQKLMDHHIYAVKVNHGIRVGICSLPTHKIYGLAKKIKEVEDEALG